MKALNSWIVPLVIGIVIGVLWQRLRYSAEIRQLTRQLANMMPFNLNHPIVPQYTHRVFDPLLRVLNTTLHAQQEEVTQLTRQAQQMKQDFLNIAHDLRTPLTAIYGYLELMKQPTLGIQQRQTYITTASERAKLLQQLIQDLFFLGKLEARSIQHDVQPLSLDTLVTESVANCYELLNSRDINVTLDIAEGVMIHSDCLAVQRIVHNLLLNAIQHGKSALYVSLTDDAVLTVRNPIANSDELDIQSVFKRHYTSTPSRNTANSGLGLTICYELCQQLRHTITAVQEQDDFVVDVSFKQ